MSPVPNRPQPPPKIAAQLYAGAKPGLAVLKRPEPAPPGRDREPRRSHPILWLIGAGVCFLLGWAAARFAGNDPFATTSSPPAPAAPAAPREKLVELAAVPANLDADLKRIEAALTALTQQVEAGLRDLDSGPAAAPETGTAPAVDLSPVQASLEALGNELAEIREVLETDRAEAPAPVDLAPLQAALDELGEGLESVRETVVTGRENAVRADQFDALASQVAELDGIIRQSVEAAAPPAPVFDPEPWTRQFEAMQASLVALETRLGVVADAATAAADRPDPGPGIDELRASLRDVQATLNDSRTSLEDLRSGVDRLQPVTESVRQLARSVDTIRAVPVQTGRPAALPDDVEGTLNQLVNLVGDMRRDLLAHRDRIATLSGQVADLGRLPTNILRVSGVMQRHPTTLLYRSRVVLYPETAPPPEPAPVAFDEGNVILTPATFPTRSATPVLWAEDTVLSPSRTRLTAPEAGLIGPGQAALP